MLALWQYVLHESASLEPGGKALKHAWVHFALAIVFLSVAMLCKPSAMMAPLIAAVLDWLIVGGSLRRSILSAMLLLAAIAPWIVVAKLVQSGSPIDAVAVWHRPLIAADALAFYLYKLAVPFDLAACYRAAPLSPWPADGPSGRGFSRRPSPRRSSRAKATEDGSAPPRVVMLLVLAPVLGLVPFDYHASRPSPITTCTWRCSARLPGGRLEASRPRRRRGELLGIWAPAPRSFYFWASASTNQVTTWHDQLSLWSHAVEVAPQSPTAHVNFGAALAREGPEFLPAAYVEFSKAGELNPLDVAVQNNLAAMTMRMGRTDEAIAHMQRAIQIEDQLGIDPQEGGRQKMIENRRFLAGIMRKQHRPREAADLYRSGCASTRGIRGPSRTSRTFFGKCETCFRSRSREDRSTLVRLVSANVSGTTISDALGLE